MSDEEIHLGIPSVDSKGRRALHFFWVIDSSGSMSIKGKMEQVDQAISECLPAMREVAQNNADVDVFVRTIAFSNDARWIERKPVPVSEFNWTSVEPGGVTEFGKALDLVTDALEGLTSADAGRAISPVVVVVTDGQPTDADWESALERLMHSTWGPKSQRVGILIGENEKPDVLETFTGNVEHVFKVTNATQLIRVIKIVSTSVVAQVSEARVANEGQTKMAIAQIKFDDDDDDATW